MASQVKVCVITDNDLFEVEIDASHPLRHAISLNAVACHSGFPLPSIGMAVAIANPSGDAPRSSSECIVN